jgi:hypothetical protein
MRAAWIIIIALVACRSDEKASPPTQSAPPPPAPVVSIDRDALLAGKTPDAAPEMEIVNAQCRV